VRAADIGADSLHISSVFHCRWIMKHSKRAQSKLNISNSMTGNPLVSHQIMILIICKPINCTEIDLYFYKKGACALLEK
jgi:hypothetical protein